jgi:O-antigen/teichoic acid export membrane protein
MYGPAQLGFYALGTTVVAVANIVAEFGMNRAVVRYVAQYSDEQDIPRLRGIILLSLGVTFALGCALSIGIFLGAGFLAETVFNKPSLEAPFRAFSVAVPFFTLMSMALYATEGFQTVKYSSIVKGFWQPLANIILVVAVYPLGAQALGAAAAYTVSMIIGSALALYYLRRLVPNLLDRATPPLFERRTAFNVSGQAWVSQMAELTNVWVAVAVLGIFASGEAVGIYNAAARTAWVSGVVYMVFSGIFSPMISALYGAGHMHDLSDLYKDVSKWIFSAGLAVFLLMLLLSKDIMAVFGSAFVSGWVVMIIVAAAQLFSLSIGATNRILIMTDYQKIYMWAVIAGLITGLAMSFALVPTYGMTGAAWATAGSIVLPNVITLVAIRRVMNLWPYTRQHLKPVIAGLSAAAIAFVVRELFSLTIGLSAILILTPLFVAGYAVLLLGLGLSSSDRQFLKAVWIAARRAGQRTT